MAKRKVRRKSRRRKARPNPARRSKVAAALRGVLRRGERVQTVTSNRNGRYVIVIGR